MQEFDEKFLENIINGLNNVSHIDAAEIPTIDLYMDQVTTFMDRHLRDKARKPEEDKILTKTMINNYAKNDLLPPPVKKKYSKEHMIVLIFIYYFKNVLSIADIKELLGPLTSKYFDTNAEIDLDAIYNEVFSLEETRIDSIKNDINKMYEESKDIFPNLEGESQKELQKFAFISMLSYDVYIKKLMIEKMIDDVRNEQKDVEEKKVDKKAEKKAEKKIEKK